MADDDDQDMTPGEQVFLELQGARAEVASLTTERDRLRGEVAWMETEDIKRRWGSILRERDEMQAERDAAQALLVEEQRGHEATRKALDLHRNGAQYHGTIMWADQAELERQRPVIEAARHLASHGPAGILSGIDPTAWAVERDSRWAALRVALAALPSPTPGSDHPAGTSAAPGEESARLRDHGETPLDLYWAVQRDAGHPLPGEED